MANLVGTEGADSLIGEAGAVEDSIFGRGGADTLRGGLSADLISGGDGDDLIEGGRGADTLSGGAGNDTFLYLSRFDFAAERIGDFGAGDRIDLSALGLAWLGDAGFSGNGNEIRVTAVQLEDGTPGTQLLIDLDGDALADASLTLIGAYRLEMAAPGMVSLVANRLLNGGGGADTLVGGEGHDTLRGLAGNDSLLGGAGNDRLNGGDGADTLVGGLGADVVEGGAGADVFIVGAVAHLAGDSFNDFGAEDRIDLSAFGAGFRFIAEGPFTGRAGEIRVVSSDDQDVANFQGLAIDVDGDGRGDVRLRGYLGALDETAAGSLVLKRAGAVAVAGTDTADSLAGTNGSDAFTGLGGDDSLAGAGGHDRLDGGDGADTLSGGSGFDSLVGGAGNDLLIGGFGGDAMTGGAGSDTFRILSGLEIGRVVRPYGHAPVSDARSFDTIHDFTPGDVLDLSALGPLVLLESGQETVPGALLFAGGYLSIDSDGDGAFDSRINLPGFQDKLVETALGSGLFKGIGGIVATGTAAADTLVGTEFRDTLFGASGNDLLYGLGEADVLRGDRLGYSENGSDTLYGGGGNDILHGGDGNDLLFGDDGADTMYGSEGGIGADTMYGGNDDDLMYAGSGNDLLFGGDGADTIDGTGGGIDRFDLGAGADTLILDVSGVASGTLFGFEQGDGIEISDSDWTWSARSEFGDVVISLFRVEWDYDYYGYGHTYTILRYTLTIPDFTGGVDASWTGGYYSHISHLYVSIREQLESLESLVILWTLVRFAGDAGVDERESRSV